MESAQGACPTVSLSNGLEIPILGLGTSHHGGYSHDAVLYALQECGVRHVDTARRYGCEAQLGRALAECGVARDDLWVTTKLWPGDYGYRNARQACLESCSHLGLDYLDLYLMHWPDCQAPGRSNRETRAETWRALEELYAEGVCRAIGVSNFLERHLQELKEDCSIIPHVNQSGVVTIPKSTKKERVLENSQVFGFCLEGRDMAELGQMHDGRHVSWDPTRVQ